MSKFPIPPTTASRVRGGLFGLAVCDALGDPVEFHARHSFSQVTEMLPNSNFGLPPGCFTDDTSMALCLGRSLVVCGRGKARGGRVLDQVRRYHDWWSKGYMSSTGNCFDVGVSTRAAIGKWVGWMEGKSGSGRGLEGVTNDDEMRQEEMAQAGLEIIQRTFRMEKFCGNGSLMRVLPAALVAENREQAILMAKESSLITHPHVRCVEACIAYCEVVWQALQDTGKEGLVSVFARHEFTDPVLKDRFAPYKKLSAWTSVREDSVRSTGYVVDSLEAALWAFFSTDSFEAGAVRAVNLGDDADTIGAIYGGVAGTFYGFEGIPVRWLSGMKRKDLIEGVVADILQFKHHSYISFALREDISRKSIYSRVGWSSPR